MVGPLLHAGCASLFLGFCLLPTCFCLLCCTCRPIYSRHVRVVVLHHKAQSRGVSESNWPGHAGVREVYAFPTAGAGAVAFDWHHFLPVCGGGVD